MAPKRPAAAAGSGSASDASDGEAGAAPNSHRRRASPSPSRSRSRSRSKSPRSNARPSVAASDSDADARAPSPRRANRERSPRDHLDSDADAGTGRRAPSPRRRGERSPSFHSDSDSDADAAGRSPSPRRKRERTPSLRSDSDSDNSAAAATSDDDGGGADDASPLPSARRSFRIETSLRPFRTRASYTTQQQAQAQLQHHQPQLGTVPHLLAGGVAGAVSKTCTAPLARLTILFQVQGMHSDVATMRNTSIWREASRIVYEEGFRAFWKGNLVTIAHRLPYSSISFYAYERYKNLLQMLPGLEKNGGFGADVGVRLLGGGLSGITAASMTYPLDLVRTRLAAQVLKIWPMQRTWELHGHTIG